MKSLALIFSLLFFPILLFAQTNNARMLSGTNTVTGASYTFVALDATRVTAFTNSSAVAATLPSGMTAGFGAGTVFTVQALGAGGVTVTCSGCLIFSANSAGSSSLVLAQGAYADIYGAGLNYNANTASLGGGSGDVKTTPSVTQNIVQPSGTTFSANSLSNVTYVEPSDNWSLSPSGSVSVGANTVTLSTCPRGIMTSASAGIPSWYATNWTWVHLAGTGTPEDAVVTATTCTQGGGASGTITFTAANSHTAGFTVGTSSMGVQEAINAAMVKVPGYSYTLGGHTIVPPLTNGIYFWTARVTIPGRQARVEFKNGANVVCQMSDTCLYIGDPATIYAANGATLDGFHADAGVINGNYAMIYDNGQSVMMRNVQPFFWYGRTPNVSGAGGDSFGSIITVDKDEAATIENLDFSVNAPAHCSTDFCTVAVKGVAAGAPVIRIKDSNLSFQCAMNGVDNQGANTLRISDTVIQGYPQFGVRSTTNYSTNPTVQLDNVYLEVGACTNPLGIGQAGLIVENGWASLRGVVGPAGNIPQYANSGTTGATQYNYYVVAHSSGRSGPTPPLYAGIAKTNGSAGNITVLWPQIGNTGTITYDVLCTTSPNANPAPYGTLAGGANCGAASGSAWNASTSSAAVGLAAGTVCASNICTLNTTVTAATTAYAVSSAANANYCIGLPYWPGGIILGAVNDQSSCQSPTTMFIESLNGNTNAGYITSNLGAMQPTVFAQYCTNVSYPGVWVECGENDAVGVNNSNLGATLLANTLTAGPVTAGLKGRLNLGGPSTYNPGHLITLVDTNFSKTSNTSQHRPTWDATDAYIALDHTGNVSVTNVQLAFGAPVSISNYIRSNPDNASWLERLTASMKTFTVPITLTGCAAGTYLKADGTGCAIPSGTISGLTLGQDIIGTGPTSVTSKPRACDASVQAGADICAQINACYLAASTTSTRAGTIDARGYPIGSVQACNSNPFAGGNKSGQLLLGAYTIATSSTWVTPQKKFRIIGEGGASPLGNNGNTMSVENTTIQPCISNGSPTGCTSALQKAANQLFIEPVYNLLASSSCTESGTTATCTTTAAHNFGSATASRVVVAGVSVGGYNGTFTLTALTSTTFSYTAGAGLGTGNGGTATAPARQHGPYSLTGSGLTGTGNYYPMIALGGNDSSAGYDGNGTCGTGPVGANWNNNAFGSTVEQVAFDGQGLAGVGAIYSGNIQERGGFLDVSFSNYGGGTSGPQTEGFGWMWDRNSYNHNDKCDNSTNGGPSHFYAIHPYCDASNAVASANQGICGVLAGNHTESDGTGAGGLAQYGIQCPGTERGLNNGGTQKTNYGFWIENYDDGKVDDCHFENINKDPVYLHGTNGWTSQGWLFSSLDFASASGSNNAVVHLDVGTNNNRVMMVRGSAGANPAGVRDEAFGCPGAFGAAPPCIVNGSSGGNPVTDYVQGGFNVFNSEIFGNVASGPVITSGTGAPSGACVNGSVWRRTDGTGSSDYVCQNLLYYPRTVTVASGTAALGTAAIASGACASVVTVAATGTATTDNILKDFNADPTGVTGYAPTSTGVLTIYAYPTANNVNFKVCNNTTGSITPGAITLNWKVLR